MASFQNHIKFNSKDAIVKYSFANGGLDFKGLTKGLAIKYVVEGCEKYSVEGKEVLVGKREFMLLRKDICYEAKIPESKNIANGICIDLLDDDSILSSLDRNDFLFQQSFCCSVSAEIGRKLFQMSKLKPSEKASPNDIIEIIASLNQFCQDIKLYSLTLQTKMKNHHSIKHLLSRLLAAKDYLHANFHKDISLDRLAKYAGISKFHFVRLFKLIFKLTPLEMQTTLRISRAKYLMKENHQSLSQIAYELGYVDLSSFSKKFKKISGLTPSYYLKNI